MKNLLDTYEVIAKNINPMEDYVIINKKKWTIFNFDDVTINEIIKTICTDYPCCISRGEIINYLRQEDACLLNGFVKSMIFYLEQEEQGPYSLSKILINKQDVIRKLQQVDLYLLIGDIESAHKEMITIPQLGQTALSVYLYFRGRSLGLDKYPVIIRDRIINRLNMYNSEVVLLSHIMQCTLKVDAKAYTQYVMLMHDLASKREDIQIPTDSLELGVDFVAKHL